MVENNIRKRQLCDTSSSLQADVPCCLDFPGECVYNIHCVNIHFVDNEGRKMSSRRLPLEQALLGFLMQGPMHGYDLHRRIEEELGVVWYMGISNIYGALKRLEQAGHVESTLSPQEGRPPRKVYRITSSGRRSFLDWVRRPIPTIRDMRVEFLAKLYFFRALGLEGAEELIVAQEAVCRERVKLLEQSAAQCAPHDFNRLVYDFRRHQIEAILDWLIEVRARSEEQRNSSSQRRIS